MPSFRTLFLAALAVFLLAALTGAFMRFGILYGMAGLNYANVRHAHSHLMYFGWVTPALMALLAAHLPRLTESPVTTGRPPTPAMPRLITLVIGLGLLAYVPFLLFGYSSAEIGAARLPLSVMAASLNVLAWYAFAVLYRRQTAGAPPGRPLWLWNAAVAFLLLATLGVIGLPIVILTGVEDPFWSLFFTHLFLDLFSEGWLVLGVLGLGYAAAPDAARHPWARRGGELLVAGLPVVFLLYLPVSMTPAVARWIGSIGGLLVVAGTMANVVALWSTAGPRWRAPLAFLALKAAMLALILVPPLARWAEGSLLRIPYLHWLLLGFVTLGLFAAAEERWGIAGRRAMTVAVVLLVATLMPLTGLWPPALGGVWRLHAAAWAALAPAIVAAWVLFSAARHRQETHDLSLNS